MVFSNPDGLSSLERSEVNARAKAPMDGLMKFVVKILLLVFVVGIGISFFSNGTKLSVMHDYGLKQYLLNFIHFQDVQYNFVTNAAKVKGYSDIIKISEAQSTKSVVTLKDGNHFRVNGYQKDGNTYWYAAEAYDGNERKVFWIPDGPEWRKLWKAEKPEKHMLIKHTPVKVFVNLRKMVEASWLKNIDFTIIPKDDKQAIEQARANESLVQLPKPVSALGRLKDILLDENHN